MKFVVLLQHGKRTTYFTTSLKFLYLTLHYLKTLLTLIDALKSQ
jgi:hypothetical protein